MKTFESNRKLFLDFLSYNNSEQGFSEELFNQTDWTNLTEYLQAISPNCWIYFAFAWITSFEGYEYWEILDLKWTQHYETHMAQ